MLVVPEPPVPEDQVLKTIAIMATAFTLALASVALPDSAQAAGCLKGAAVGGIAGHFAGHHGLVGAGIGCVVGHHEATRRMREQQGYGRW
jgi:hypothetical protein